MKVISRWASTHLQPIYFNWRIITLTILCWSLPYISTNQPWVHMCPPILNLPPHPIPLGCPRAWDLSVLLHSLNLPWSSILRMIIYMFQCCSLISSRPFLLPYSPKVCSLHLSLFCCLADRIVIQFSSVQSLDHVRLFETPWTAACQASLSITNSRSLLKLMSIESGVPSNHLILCHPLLFLPSVFPSIRVFLNESVLRIT